MLTFSAPADVSFSLIKSAVFKTSSLYAGSALTEGIRNKSNNSAKYFYKD